MAYVYLNPHKQQLEFAQQQRAQLDAERQTISQRLTWLNERIAEWDGYIQAVTPIAENDAGQFLQGKGLADICRMALDAYGDWVSAQQVRGYLNQLGIKLEYTNEMAVLHTTLRRVGQAARDRRNTNTFYAKKGLPCPKSMVLI